MPLSSFYSRAFDFNGKASLSEFWWPAILIWHLVLLPPLVFARTAYAGTVGLLVLLFLIVHSLPFLSCLVRRLRDGGHSRGWALLLILPLAMIYFLNSARVFDLNTGVGLVVVSFLPLGVMLMQRSRVADSDGKENE